MRMARRRCVLGCVFRCPRRGSCESGQENDEPRSQPATRHARRLHQTHGADNRICSEGSTSPADLYVYLPPDLRPSRPTRCSSGSTASPGQQSFRMPWSARRGDPLRHKRRLSPWSRRRSLRARCYLAGRFFLHPKAGNFDERLVMPDVWPLHACCTTHSPEREVTCLAGVSMGAGGDPYTRAMKYRDRSRCGVGIARR